MECAICYKKIEQNYPKLECGHTIHMRCMQRWYRECRIDRCYTLCPLCKETVKIYPNTRQSARISYAKSMALVKLGYIFEFKEEPNNFDLWMALIINFIGFVKLNHEDLLRSDSWSIIMDTCVSFCDMLQLSEGISYLTILCHMGTINDDEMKIIYYDFKKDVRIKDV